MRLLSYILYNQNWNIGFIEQTPENLIENQQLGKVQWMKHQYKDRWFADPFILKVTQDEIVIFVEECKIKQPKGILCELVINRHTKKLKQRYVLLELNTHLSYPAIIRKNGKVYVYPENGASRKLNLYEYDEKNHKLINPKCILDEAVADATILHFGEEYYLCATKYPDTQSKVYLYKSDSLQGQFLPCNKEPFNTSLDSSRPAGDWIISGKALYRPSQNCVTRYGSAISFMYVKIAGNSIKEIKSFSIHPVSWRYNLGIHTLNFKDGLCVVDSYGYLYPIIARIVFACIHIKHKIGL